VGARRGILRGSALRTHQHCTSMLHLPLTLLCRVKNQAALMHVIQAPTCRRSAYPVAFASAGCAGATTSLTRWAPSLLSGMHRRWTEGRRRALCAC